jgi:HTH-type transcriptional regulator, sugar sensing transcriptional regulator
MLLLHKKHMDVLVELGFTISEAKVYLALTQNGTSPISSITEATEIHREHLYQIVNSLEKKGLIEKQIGTPTLYKATPLEAALLILVEHKQEQITELKTKTTKLIQETKINNQNITQPTLNKQPENHQFIIVPGKENIINKLKGNIQKTQTNIDVVTTPTRFSTSIQEFANDYKQALQRGIKIQICTEKHAPEKAALEILQKLAKNPDFEVKFFPDPTDAIVTIFDKKQAFVITSTTANISEAASLCSTNSSFIALAQNYFECKWNKSTSIEKVDTFATEEINH